MHNLQKSIINAMAAVIVLLIITCPAGLLAGDSPLWGDLEPGEYGVGFKTIEQYDYSRSFGPKYDYFGNLLPREKARPVQVAVWYPAPRNPEQVTMLYSDYTFPYPEDSRFFDYLGALQERENQTYLGLFDMDRRALLDIMSLPATAVRDADPATGPFPLLIYSPDLRGGIAENAVLCEFLASHGFIIAATHSVGSAALNPEPTSADVETMIRDREFAIGVMRDFPEVDTNKLGAFGAGFGGLASLLLQMRNSAVDAIACLDGAFCYGDYPELATGNPYYSPTAAQVPMLSLHRAGAEHMDLSVLSSLEYSNRVLVGCTGMTHSDFSTHGMLATLKEGTPADAVDSRKNNHRAVGHYVLNFFRAHLNKDERGMAFVKAQPVDNGFAADMLTVTSHQRKELPPTVDQFLAIIESRGVPEAISVADKFDLFNPESSLLPAGTINALGYRYLQRGQSDDAVAMMELGVKAFPNLANAWDSYGEACLSGGDNAKALSCYKKALELLPTDETIPEQFKEQIRNGATAAIERLEAELAGQ